MGEGVYTTGTINSDSIASAVDNNLLF
jgi:hypothetical protein